LDQSVAQEMAALLPRLRRFAYGLTGSIDAGDDLLQSACERALARLHQWQTRTSPSHSARAARICSSSAAASWRLPASQL
jgi:DNA-directed RNA polymerase specialized sigma24 family protein